MDYRRETSQIQVFNKDELLENPEFSNEEINNIYLIEQIISNHPNKNQSIIIPTKNKRKLFCILLIILFIIFVVGLYFWKYNKSV